MMLHHQLVEHKPQESSHWHHSADPSSTPTPAHFDLALPERNQKSSWFGQCISSWKTRTTPVGQSNHLVGCSTSAQAAIFHINNLNTNLNINSYSIIVLLNCWSIYNSHFCKFSANFYHFIVHGNHCNTVVGINFVLIFA